jgi:hypothetical protein
VRAQDVARDLKERIALCSKICGNLLATGSDVDYEKIVKIDHEEILCNNRYKAA